MDYTYKMLRELEYIERFSERYKEELKLLSKRIRNDLWNHDNTFELASFLANINKSLKKTDSNEGFNLDDILGYVYALKKCGVFTNPKCDAIYYERLIDEILLLNAQIIIEDKWKNVIFSEDSTKTFIEIFGEVFTQCIDLRRDDFFCALRKTDILCRAVKGIGYQTDRFIPWPNKVQNRWNPPGKTYLYLSYEEKLKKYNSELSISEYVCLQECRAVKGDKYSLCLFECINEGNILDLSYNDIELWNIRMELTDYEATVQKEILRDLTSSSGAVEKYKRSKKKLKEAIKAKSEKVLNRDIIASSVAKQYLKMVCNAIYKKVDEKDEDKKEMAYKSFHVLAEYLESKGVTGLIYPCTRTNKVVGKNLVLFNIHDAAPIEGSIKEITY